MKKIDSVYLHVSNSGVTFSVTDEGFGPTIVISSSAFGNLSNVSKYYVNKESLRKLGDMFIKASEEEYSEDYCEVAKVS